MIKVLINIYAYASSSGRALGMVWSWYNKIVMHFASYFMNEVGIKDEFQEIYRKIVKFVKLNFNNSAKLIRVVHYY